MLRGPTIDLRRAEKADVPLLVEWTGDIEMNGAYEGFGQVSVSELEKEFEADPGRALGHVVTAKDGTPIGFIAHGKCGGRLLDRVPGGARATRQGLREPRPFS